MFCSVGISKRSVQEGVIGKDGTRTGVHKKLGLQAFVWVRRVLGLHQAPPQASMVPPCLSGWLPKRCFGVKQACAGPQYARRDVQVALAPSISAQLIISPLRCEMPRPSCGRAVRFSGAQEARPQ